MPPFFGFTFLSKWTYRTVRWAYAAIFLYAGVNKLVDPKSFAVVIEAFGLVPDSWIMPMAIGVPVVEIIAALGLLFDFRGSLSAITGLLVLFLAIVGYGVWLGLDIDCGCFGPEDPEGEAYASLRPTLYRNILLILGISYLYWWRLRESVEKRKRMPLFKKLLLKIER
jgi:uncharacterized membrane protein YphA (DoxX/SURF4 family)